MLLELAEECTPRHSQKSGGFRFDTVTLFECHDELIPLGETVENGFPGGDDLSCRCCHGLARSCSVGTDSWNRMLNFGWQVTKLDGVPIRKDDCPFDDVVQLPNIPRPVVRFQRY